MGNMNKEAWNRHARRFFSEDISLDVVDYCGLEFPNDTDLNLIGDVSGKRVLEIGSGSCNCGIALAKQGAHVTCLDLSGNQLLIGRELAQKANVTIEQIESDMTDLSAVPARSMDLVLSVSAMMYVENIGRVFAEANRVLKPGGRLVFSTNHPVMMAIGATELWPEEKSDPNYGYTGPVVWKWNEKDDFYFTDYRRPLMDYVNALGENAFHILRMEELMPKIADTDWDETEKAIRMRFPSVLVIAAQKLRDLDG
ncbi:MAG TPA: class I SAM-dependent methyltransferase [Clostridia bacterium]|nr:class I SAM-dependent methyltransferase [Clostridia bacterium]